MNKQKKDIIPKPRESTSESPDEDSRGRFCEVSGANVVPSEVEGMFLPYTSPFMADGIGQASFTSR